MDQIWAQVLKDAPLHAEIGGVLIGSDDAAQGAIHIEDFAPVQTEVQSPNGHYIAHAPVDRFLSPAIKSREPGKITGYYRTHIDDGLRLRSADLKSIEKWFRDASNVFLVIKRLDSERATAGFFFWNQNSIFSDFSFLEFPFAAAELSSGEELELGSEKASVQPARAESPPRPPNGAVTIPQESPDRTPKEFGQSSHWKNGNQPPSPVSVRPLADSGKTHYHGSPTNINPVYTDKKGIWPILNSKVVAVTAGVFVLIILTILILVRTYAEKDLQLTTHSRQAGSNLGLHVERFGSELKVSWNRSATAIQNATQGNLAIIEDRGEPLFIPLSSAQLANGSVSYTPSSTRLECRLEIIGVKGQSSIESVLAVSRPTLTPSVGDVNRSPAAIEHGPDRKATLQRKLPERQQEPPPPSLPAPDKSARIGTRRFVPPEKTPSVPVPTSRVATIEPESIPNVALNPTGTAILRRLPDVGTQQPAPLKSAPVPPPPPRVQTVPAELPKTLQTPKPPKEVRQSAMAGLTSEPQVLRQVEPQVPVQIRSLLFTEQNVQIRVKINESGRVVGAAVANQKGSLSGRLVPLALDAARLWVFKPARRGEQNVPSEHVIEFVFSRASH